MKKTWSISTTVRNPERLRDFLKVLKGLEGQPFKSENQKNFQTLLIKNRLYKPTNLTEEEQSYFDNVEKEMSSDVADQIFNTQNYEDPAMRGRNSVAPLNKMGLCIAKDSSEAVKITDFGNYFLSDDYDLGKVFFIHFLKWQLPNPDSRTFRDKDGFNIKPFIGVLHLINEVNKKWTMLGNNPVGINKEEFSLFAITLIDYTKIESHAETLIKYRLSLSKLNTESKKKEFKENYRKNVVIDFFETNNSKEITTLINNLKDYSDNAIRYFRLTRYFYIRGNGFYIDLEPRRSVEINKLLESDNAQPLAFSNLQEYLDYITDINQPILPWETERELKEIIDTIAADIKQYQNILKNKNIPFLDFNYLPIDQLNTKQKKDYIEKLREYRRTLQDKKIRFDSQNIDEIKNYIDRIKFIYSSKVKKSIELEKLMTFALNALNDALLIKPNYPVGDDNEPTFTAPAGKPDIECFYDQFNAICEVTMLTDRSQWYNEGQPVMRHLRDFEIQYANKKSYCLFIAPKLHTDTINTFWNSIKYGYRGSKQKIVPLSLSQFLKLLDTLVELKNKQKFLSHSDILHLFDNILDFTNKSEHSDQWLQIIPEIINNWKESITQ